MFEHGVDSEADVWTWSLMSGHELDPRAPVLRYVYTSTGMT